MSDKPLLKTPGEMLGEARQAQGLSLDELAERTKIPVKVLKALEMDEYHKVSGPLYIKSFLRTCAVDLGLDAGQVIDAYGRYGGEAGAAGPEDDMVWREEEVQVTRVGLPWSRIALGAGLVIILVGIGMFALRGCAGERGPETGMDDDGSSGKTAADLRRGSLLVAPPDSSVEPAREDGDAGSGQTAEVDAEAEDQPDPAVAEPTPAPTEDPERSATEENATPTREAESTIERAADRPVARQEEPPPNRTPGPLPPAVAGNAGTPFSDGRAWPVVMRLVTDLPVRAEVRRDGESEFQTVAWNDPVELPMRDIRPGRAYGVREGLVVYWGATDHFSLRLDRVVGVEVSINGVARDISSLRPGQEIILDDHSAGADGRP